MKLTDILKSPGIHVWMFQREKPGMTPTEAHRRVTSYLQTTYKHVTATAHAAALVFTTTYAVEPIIVIEVDHITRKDKS